LNGIQWVFQKTGNQKKKVPIQDEGRDILKGKCVSRQLSKEAIKRLERGEEKNNFTLTP